MTEHEVLMLHNAPSPEQLRKLSTTAITLARAGDMKFKRSRYIDPTYLWVDSTSGGDSDSFENLSGRYTRRISGVKIDEHTQEELPDPIDRWSLRYKEMTHQRIIGELWSSVLRTYSFEWDNDSVFVSQCRVGQVPSVEQAEINATREIYGVEDDHPQATEIFGTPTWSRVEFVDSEACGQLLGSLRARYARLRLSSDEERVA